MHDLAGNHPALEVAAGGASAEQEGHPGDDRITSEGRWRAGRCVLHVLLRCCVTDEVVKMSSLKLAQLQN